MNSAAINGYTSGCPTDSSEPSTLLYFDHNATTPMEEAAIEAMVETMTHHWGNPSCKVQHSGRRALKALDKALERMSESLGANDREDSMITFTSGGTEVKILSFHGITFL